MLYACRYTLDNPFHPRPIAKKNNKKTNKQTNKKKCPQTSAGELELFCSNLFNMSTNYVELDTPFFVLVSRGDLPKKCLDTYDRHLIFLGRKSGISLKSLGMITLQSKIQLSQINDDGHDALVVLQTHYLLLISAVKSEHLQTT